MKKRPYRTNNSSRINVNYFDFENVYDVDNLKDYTQYAQNSLKALEEEMEIVKTYMRDIYEHSISVIAAPKRIYIIASKRTPYRTNKVSYRIDIKEVAMVDGEFIYSEKRVYHTLESFDYEGTKRHEFYKNLDNLMRKYPKAVLLKKDGVK